MARIATAVVGRGAIGASWSMAFRTAVRAVRLREPDAATTSAVAASHGAGMAVTPCSKTAAPGRLCSRGPGEGLKRLCFLALIFLTTGVSEAREAPRTRMWRLDCGEIEVDDLNVYSSRRLYAGQKKTLTVSCYLIKHGREYMLWDSGLAAEFIKRPESSSGFRMSLQRTVVDQLGRLNIRPEQITILGISHPHYDHIGQAASFPNARLLIGADDLPGLRAEVPPFAVEPQRLAPWLKNDAPMEGVIGDKDVFGDGSVVMIATPGHTPGHHSLLVRLRHTGTVLLTGDLYHFQEQLENAEVPPFNDRVQTLASFARMGALAKQSDARIIIQHEVRDIAKLPLFPKAAS